MLELFANPGYLAAGGALVSSPIIIHLINRMRFKRLRWAAMEFLLKAQKRNRRRLIIEQLILLILRCLLVALVAFLVSRFHERHVSAATEDPREFTHVVFVGDSLSENDRWNEDKLVQGGQIVAVDEANRDMTCLKLAKLDIKDKILEGVKRSTTNDKLVLIQH